VVGRGTSCGIRDMTKIATKGTRRVRGGGKRNELWDEGHDEKSYWRN
jgi:hypothetical protein